MLKQVFKAVNRALHLIVCEKGQSTGHLWKCSTIFGKIFLKKLVLDKTFS